MKRRWGEGTKAVRLPAIPIHSSYADWFFPQWVGVDGSWRRLPVAEDLIRICDPARGVTDRLVRPEAEGGAGPKPMADAGGAYVVYGTRKDDGLIARDPSTARRLLGPPGGAFEGFNIMAPAAFLLAEGVEWGPGERSALVLAALAAPSAPDGAKRQRGPTVHNLARAFAYWGLRDASVGTIAAARMILAWESEISAAWLDSASAQGRAAGLAALVLSGGRLGPRNMKLLRSAERAVRKRSIDIRRDGWLGCHDPFDYDEPDEAEALSEPLLVASRPGPSTAGDRSAG